MLHPTGQAFHRSLLGMGFGNFHEPVKFDGDYLTGYPFFTHCCP
jgi:hypothetical protein